MNLDRRESDIKRAVQRYLSYSGLFWRRMNSGSILQQRNGRQRMIEIGPPGTADFLILLEQGPNVLPLWVEVKSPRGKLRPSQEAFRNDVLRRGHEFLIVRDIETLDRKIKELS